MMENLQAKIGANIKDFVSKMKEVDRRVKETAMETVKPIDVDIDDLMWGLREADAKIQEFVKEATKPFDADISDFMWGLREMEIETKRVLKKSEKTIGADISDFLRKAAQVAVVARTLAHEKVVIKIEARWKKFQNTISKIATNIRSLGELGASTFKGIGMSLSPAIVPLISTLGGLLGQLGPMLGTVAGSTFALASAFGVAGIGAGAFTAIAVSNLKDVFTASADVKKIQEKLAMETDTKKRAELLEKMTRIQKSLNSEQTKAYQAMGKLQSVWRELSSSLEKPTIKIFTGFLGIMSDVLKRLEPLFQGSVKAAQRLTDSLANVMKGERMTEFIEYLNETGGQMFETMTKAVGNFVQGILSMMVAFGALTDDTSKGFLAMSESFATWAAGLGESKKFQSFVDYVKENMPKIRSIFSDAFQGIINVFAAFAPSSADMMTSLESMMERFKEWSSTLSTNKGFQDFIDYIKTNGPVVVDAIGNIVTSLVNIGVALAPMGEKVLGIVNSIIEWTNAMLENHPIIGKIGATVLVLSGLLLAIAPNIIAFGTLFGGAGTVIGGAATLIMTKTSLMRAKFILGMQMMVTSMLKTTAQMVTTAAQFVAKWTVIGAQSLVHAAKVAAAWVLATGKAMAKAVAGMVATAAKFVAKWVWMGVQSLLQAARIAAAWFIALGPIGWVTAAVVGLAILIIANWDKIKAKTIEIWNKVSNSVKDAWEKAKTLTMIGIAKLVGYIVGLVRDILKFRADMLDAGKRLIEGLIDGILSMGKKAISKVKELGSNIISAAKNIFDINSPSRVFATIGKFVGQGLAEGVQSTEKNNEKVMTELGNVITGVAKANAEAVTAIAKDAEKERTEIQEESAAKSKEITAKARQDILDIEARASANKRKLTAYESLRIQEIWRDAEKKQVKNAEAHHKELAKVNNKAWDAMVQRESEVAKERLDAVKQFIDNKKKLEQISIIDEANLWKQATSSFKDGTQEKIEAQIQYRDALAKVNNEITSINETYAGKMTAINEKLRADEEALTKTYTDSLNNRMSSLMSFAGTFDAFDAAVDKSGSELLSNLNSQVDGFKKWQTEIEKISGKAIDDGLMAELREMGPKALPELLALNSLTADQLANYSALYQEKAALARTQAEAELVGMKADTTKRIAELRLAANKELTVLQVEWTTKIQDLTKSTNDELKSLTQIGKDAIAGLMAGMSSMNGPLQKEAQRIANTVQATIKKALQIHSPSRVLEKLGSFAGEGLIVGLSDSISAVASVSRQLAEAATPSLAGMAMAPLDTQPQMDALHRQIKQELSVDMTMNHIGSIGNGGGTGSPNVYVTIDAKNVKEFNDVVKIFDKQSFQRQ